MVKAPPKVLFATADETEQAFYDAASHGDIDALMSLWAEEDEVVCIHPGGARLEGLDAIRESWVELFNNATVEIRPTRATQFTGMLISVHTVIEEIVFETAAGAQMAYVNATNVYHKTARGWRLALHHASPATDSPSMPPLSALH